MENETPFITISVNEKFKKHHVGFKSTLVEFMTQLNIYISLYTDVNYHLIPVKTEPVIYIPVYKYNNDEFSESMESVILKRFNTLLDYLTKTDFGNTDNTFKSLLRSLAWVSNKYSGLYDQEKYFIFYIRSEDINKEVGFNIDLHTSVIYPKISRIRLKDGNKHSYISMYVDPFIRDYGIVCNLSKKFEEMRYQYNTLHLFEHLMTYAWRFDNNEIDSSYINGMTVVNGISNIYAVLDDKEKILKYLNAYFDMMLKGRNKNYWKKEKDMLIRETTRTISETRMMRSFSNTSRSDPAAYDYNYNTDIFCKWANDPIDVLIITREPIKIDIKKLEGKIAKANMSKTTVTLKKETYDYIPIEALSDKRWVRVMREDPADIIKAIINTRDDQQANNMYGIDCKLQFPDQYSIGINYYMHVLLYMHQYLPEKLCKEIDEIVCKKMHFPDKVFQFL